MFDFLKNKHTSREIIDDDLQKYFEEQKQKYFEEQKIEISKKIEIVQREKILEIQEQLMNLRIMCAEQTRKYEHEFHSAKEGKGIELAKLDSQIDLKKDILGAVLAEKDKTIEILKVALKEALKAVSNNTRAN